MSAEKIANVVRLVQHLEELPRVDWDEVERLLAEFPNWLRLVKILRYRSGALPTRVVTLGEPAAYLFLSDTQRRQLLEVFQPYALLLYPQHTPAERALRLRQNGVEVDSFCQECFHDGTPEIVEAARAVLESWEAQQALLRGAAAPAAPAEQLLRAAQGGPSHADALLQPTMPPSPEAGPDTDPAPPRTGWLRRLLARHKP